MWYSAPGCLRDNRLRPSGDDSTIMMFQNPQSGLMTDMRPNLGI